MNLLLDTHVFLWMQAAPERLGPRARQLVESADSELYLSAASTWEIAIKYALGRLELPEPPARYVPDRMRSHAVNGLAIELTHSYALSDLPTLHGDPFDRMLVAQAAIEGLAILTSDRQLEEYAVDVVRAD